MRTEPLPGALLCLYNGVRSSETDRVGNFDGAGDTSLWSIASPEDLLHQDSPQNGVRYPLQGARSSISTLDGPDRDAIDHLYVV